MQIVVFDHQDGQATLSAMAQAMGHSVSVVTSEKAVTQSAHDEKIDIFCVNPDLLTDVKGFILSIKRQSLNTPYFFLLKSGLGPEDIAKKGANDAVVRDCSEQDLYAKLLNVQNYHAIEAAIGNDSIDFPSAGGVIAKSAFNQLFLSALERADRYGERSYILFISINNYQNILALDGAYTADFAVAKLSQYLVRLRRQSDIIGQTAKNQYALLLQRPLFETEPLEAAKRFIKSFSENPGVFSEGTSDIEVSVSLVEFPSGAVIVDQIIKPNEPQAETA